MIPGGNIGIGVVLYAFEAPFAVLAGLEGLGVGLHGRVLAELEGSLTPAFEEVPEADGCLFVHVVAAEE
jgi:hypothetical protein